MGSIIQEWCVLHSLDLSVLPQGRILAADALKVVLLCLFLKSPLLAMDVVAERSDVEDFFLKKSLRVQ